MAVETGKEPCKHLTNFIHGVNFFRENFSPDCSANIALIFLTVAKQPGITQPELSEKLNISQSATSRNLKMLDIFHSGGKQCGFGLIEMKADYYERRRKACYLTAKGKKVFNNFKKAIGC